MSRPLRIDPPGGTIQATHDNPYRYRYGVYDLIGDDQHKRISYVKQFRPVTRFSLRRLPRGGLQIHIDHSAQYFSCFSQATGIYETQQLKDLRNKTINLLAFKLTLPKNLSASFFRASIQFR